jgi:phenylacetate-CoA ligase
LFSFEPTIVAGKPSVLYSLAVEAENNGASPAQLKVKKLILTGEFSPRLRGSLEELWMAECFDRYGLTEAGSVASECTAHSGGLHLLDDEFVAEAIDLDTCQPAPDGEPGELALTNLGRVAQPIIRYRTGDIVRLVRQRQCSCGRSGVMLLGGVARLGTLE